MKIEKLLESKNIAESLNEDQLVKIGKDCYEGYTSDLESRKQWEKYLDEWTKLALQVTETKTFPWTNAANVKYPLLAIAALQFHARAYPSLIPSNGKIVKCRVIGADMTGEKTERARRVSEHMSYQIMDEMDDWEEEMDKLLLCLPIVGTCFKKTYWDSAKQRNCSQLILPKALVINYWAKTIEDAERKTEIIPMSQRKLREKQLQKIYLDVELSAPTLASLPEDNVKIYHQQLPEEDETTPHTVLEQHTYLDLDEDGYSEPYIVTIDADSRQVLRIVANYTEDTIMVNDSGDIVGISAKEYYTKYEFIPNPDGGFYGIGFGRLLGPINEAANTILNQLIDAGTLSNLQTGFIGKGLRIKMGDARFTPGEWKAVNATGDDLKKQILPLPVREPSQVLFNLLNLLITAGKELASVSEIMTGKMPGQNTPATTTMATIEQGMKVFTAVYKRIFKSMTKEFRKLYLLNREYMNPQEVIDILDEEIPQSDYQGPENDIIPAADPQATTGEERRAKAEGLLQLMGLGTLNPHEVTKRILLAQEQPNIEALMPPPAPPPPDPKVQQMEAKAQLDQQKALNDMELARAKLELDAASKQQELAMKQQIVEMDLRMKQMEGMLKAKMAADQHIQKLSEAQQKHTLSLAQQQDNHVAKQKQSTLKKKE